MASASVHSPLVAGKTGSEAFFGMHSAPECAFRFRLGRFSLTGPVGGTTTSVVPPAFAVACITSSLATRGLDYDRGSVLTSLSRSRGLRQRLLMYFLTSHVLLRGRRVQKSLSKFRRIECFDGLRIRHVHEVQLRVA